MFPLCCRCFSLSLSDFADVAQVIIALANIGLAIYFFGHQRKKDQKTDQQTARLHEQNIKLQWFKELIIQPNLASIQQFYKNLHSLKEQIQSNELTEEEKLKLSAFAKQQLSLIKKSLVDVLIAVDKPFSDKVRDNVEGLVDEIVVAIFNDELKLKNPTTYEKSIGSRITYSENSLVALLYNYKGE